jgi:hypothetical protein
MAGHLARALLAAMLAIPTTVLAAPPAAAVSGLPEDGAVLLPGVVTLAAMAADVDGDGVKELVRLVPWETNPAYQAVEVLSFDGGVPRPRGQARVARAATPDDTFAGRRPSADNLLPVSVNEPARLLRWRLDGQDQLLLVSIGTDELTRPCCLTVWQVALPDGETSLRFLQDTVSSAESILAADLDADGTDEIVILETPDPSLVAAAIRRVLVLHWNGTDFDRRYADAQPSRTSGPLFSLGDSDGLPGNEAGFVEVASGADVTPTLFRVSLDASGAPLVEHALLPGSGQLAVLPGDESGEHEADELVLIDGGFASLLFWPAGQKQLVVAGTALRGGQLLGVTGRGTAARLLIQRGGAVDILDRGLQSLGGINASTPATRFVGTQLEPYVGPFPGGAPDGGDGLVFQGQLTYASPSAGGGVEHVEVGALPGLSPVGLVGPDGGWAVVGQTSTPPTDGTGGPMTNPEAEGSPGAWAFGLWLVPVRQLLRPEADGGRLNPAIEGGVTDPTRAVPTLLTNTQLTARFSAPESSISQVIVDPAIPDGVSLQNGEMQVLLADGAQGDETSFTVRLLVATPGGHGYGGRWQVRVIRGPPSLEVEEPQGSWSLHASISGRTDRGTLLQVDGAPVQVAADGSFSADVEAGLLPRLVTISASDQLGNIAEQRVSVVAPFDYRKLPWVPIIAALTVLVALILFLRAPHARPGPPADAGTLEDLE